MAPGLPNAVEESLSELPPSLKEHIECVRNIARELASLHEVDVDRVDLAAAAHDLARALGNDALLESARGYGIQLSPVALRKPVLLHGPVAAMWLDGPGGIVDTGVLEAVRCHTSGRAGMGRIAKVVFLADKLDPSKLNRYPFQDEIASLARKDLDRALLRFLDLELVDFLDRGFLIDPSTIELRNELMLAQ